MAELEICNGERAGERLALEKALVIGRGKQADAVFEDNILSRHHARLDLVEDTWRISDLESSNGTFLNGHRVAEADLHHGDGLRMGTLKFRFHAPAAKPAPIPEPPTTATGDSPSLMAQVPASDSLSNLLPDGVDSQLSEILLARLNVLAGVAPRLAGFDAESALLKALLDYVLEAFPQAERATLALGGGAGGNLLARGRGAQSAQARLSRSLAEWVRQHRSAVLSADVDADERFDAKHTLAELGIHTVMCAPLISDDQLLGVVQVDSAKPGDAFSKADLAVLLGLAGHGALAISKLRLQAKQTRQQILARDLELAERIQTSFLPSEAPKLRGYKFAHSYESAQQVGGDYFHYLRLADGRTGIAVGDVSGKGIPAALYMARLSSEMRFHALAEDSPGKALTALNTAMSDEANTGMFATVVMLALEPKRGALTISNAGHPPLLWRRSKGKVNAINAAGNIPVGMSEQVDYDETSITLPVGDSLLLYSDGVTEAMNAEQEQFGLDRLEEAFSEAPDEPEQMLSFIMAAIAEHVGQHEQSDDITLVCIQHEGR
jgi:serine phosphatase RsbU (regulator of sigma subunit)